MTKAKPLRKIGPFEAIEIPGPPGGPCVIVFHGFGADASDLLSFAQLLETPPGTSWYFVQGPLKVSDGGILGRAWFPLDVKALDEAVRAGTHLDLSRHTPEGLKKVREQAAEFIKSLSLNYSKLVLMGFSQGAMLATDLALRLPEKIAGLVILSGALLNKDLWKDKAQQKRGLPFFQSHGDLDPLLSPEYAKDLEALLLEAGLKGQLHAFRGGHEVPQEIIYKLNVFLKRVLAPAH